MTDQNKIRPFSTLALDKFFEYDLEKINMAYRLSGTIHSDLNNIRATGDEVELTVKRFYQSKLFPKYHVCDGHIVDHNLKVSPQFDIIISANSKNPVLFDLADKSELVYYESVYLFGEVKRSFYKKEFISIFSKNIQRFRQEMDRAIVPPNAIESAGTIVQVESNLTQFPMRNPIFSFMFFVNSSALDMSHLKADLDKIDNQYLPNMILLLDQGLIINVNKTEYDRGRLQINLYPEFAEDSTWILMTMDGNSALTYHYLLIIEHLNNSVLGYPNVSEYTKNLFHFNLSNFHEI